MSGVRRVEVSVAIEARVHVPLQEDGSRRRDQSSVNTKILCHTCHTTWTKVG